MDRTAQLREFLKDLFSSQRLAVLATQSLRRSFENLKALRKRMEGELIPAMVDEAECLARQDWTALSDSGKLF